MWFIGIKENQFFVCSWLTWSYVYVGWIKCAQNIWCGNEEDDDDDDDGDDDDGDDSAA